MIKVLLSLIVLQEIAFKKVIYWPQCFCGGTKQ
jgi:hypothetical protein